MDSNSCHKMQNIISCTYFSLLSSLDIFLLPPLSPHYSNRFCHCILHYILLYYILYTYIEMTAMSNDKLHYFPRISGDFKTALSSILTLSTCVDPHLSICCCK